MIKIVIVYLGLMLSFNIAASAQDSRAADFLFELGKEYYQEGNYKQALHELKKALLVEPEHAGALGYIQMVREKLGLPEEELEEAGAAEKELDRQEVIAWALEQAEAGLIPEEEEEAATKAAPGPIPESETTSGGLYETVLERRTLIELYDKYYWHNTRFDESGDRSRWAFNGRYHEVRTELKIDHNLFKDFNILVEIPYKVALWKDDFNRNTTSGIGDIWLRAKYRLWDQPLRPFYFALQPGVRFPGGYDRDDVPSLGEEDTAVELRGLLARSFQSWSGYSKLELAYRYRSRDLTDEIPYYTELCYHPQDWLQFKTTIDGIEGLTDTGDVEEDYTKWTAHVIFSPNHAFGSLREARVWKFEFAYGDTFRGKNTSDGSEVVVNISYEF